MGQLFSNNMFSKLEKKLPGGEKWTHLKALYKIHNIHHYAQHLHNVHV